LRQVRIIGIIPETAEARTFELQPLDDWKPVYKPGQFMTFVFSTISGEKRRSYSISSTHAVDEKLSITIKRVVNGEFSRYLLEHLKVGDILYTTGINGFFCLPEKVNDEMQFFFLVAGSGITPAFSLIKTLLATSNASIVLIYSNRSESEAIFLSQLQALHEKHKERFHLHLLFSNKLDVNRSRLSNTLLQSILSLYPKIKTNLAMFYVCGPLTYMQMVTITLISEGISRQNIKTESFDSTPRAKKNIPPDTTPRNVTLQINNERHHFMMQFPQTILSAARDNNIDLPYSCDTGRCGSCVAHCISGKVWMAYNEVLMDAEIEKGLVLTCQGYPVGGDVLLEVI